jgi:hypothetical protein
LLAMDDIYECTGTRAYETVLGASKTVFTIRKFDATDGLKHVADLKALQLKPKKR